MRNIYLILFTLMQILVACKPEPIAQKSKTQLSGVAVKPITASNISISFPLTSPSNNSTPTIQVDGIALNSIVKIYTDVNCAIEMGSTLANSTTAYVTSYPLSMGTFNFYTRSFNFLGDSSACSSAFATYTYLMPPSNLTYPINPANYPINIVITDNIPTNSGGAATSYTINPALPNGLSLESHSGIIYGTPTSTTNLSSYTVTATNATGSTSTILNISTFIQQPAGLTYSVANPNYYIGDQIIANSPTLASGSADSYSISPTLPSGLIFNTTTGVISGKPTTFTNSNPYTITATNSVGSTSTIIHIATVDYPPTNLSYSLNPVSYIKNSLITNNLPIVFGGTPTSFSILPPLPTGLNFDTTTGIISGTPTVISAMTPYLIKATNSGGSISSSLYLAVQVDAPTSINYSSNSYTYISGTAITSISPTVNGGAASSFSVSPALPNGLSINATTGVISGTPSAVTAANNYTVTASNITGSTSVVLSITILIPPPKIVNYSTSPASYIQNTTISNNTPYLSGGAASSFSISAPLPTGLSFNTSNGFISGTPTQLSSATNYTITATNSTGSSTFVLSIAVLIPPPTNLTYSFNPATYATTTLINNNTPSNSGGAISSYSISPSLPSGLSLDPNTGIISGTPTATQSATNYTVTASNGSGSTTATLSITIGSGSIAPTNLTYTQASANYELGKAISNNTPSNLGGVAVSYSINPFLPAGLNFNTSTGVISGTPTALSSANNYTVTASNLAGSTTAIISVTVTINPPTNLSYSNLNATYTIGETITNNSPTFSGGTPSSYSVSPSLPNGLNLNTSTGVISGMPTTDQAATNYTITATNAGGSTNKAISITIIVTNDPLYTYAWHLKNTGQTNFATYGGISGYDLHLLGTWGQGYKGQGISILISDTGVESGHEDLSANFLGGNVSKDFINGTAPNYLYATAEPILDTTVSNAHGTMVAGIIAAVGGNGIGSTGIAPKAKIAAANTLNPNVSSNSTILLDQISGSFNIINQSFGVPQCYIQAPYSWYEAQLKADRKVYVKSAGNDFSVDAYTCAQHGPSGTTRVGNSNFDGNNTNPYTIVVGALNAKGIKSSYSSIGSNIWISGFGGEFGIGGGYVITGHPEYDGPAIMTTDLSGCTYGEAPLEFTSLQNAFINGNPVHPLNPNCNYTATMNGTSAAAPTISGAIALILSANNTLSTRDIKHIIATTSVKIDPTAANKTNPNVASPSGHVWEQGWITNGAGYHFNNYYGFGAIDVDAAVNMATANYIPLPPEVQTGYISSGANLNLPIPINSAVGVTNTINVAQSYTIEAIQIIPNINHVNIGNIGIELTSPAGTKSILMNVNNSLYGLTDLTMGDVFLSNAFYGESSNGNWTIKVIDGGTSTTSGKLNDWKINIIGH